jgi:cyclopropane fatty-acyl-phospholipid synthase-like methyltransferase
MRSDEILDRVIGPDVLDVGCAGHVPNPGSPYWLHGRLRQKFPVVVGIDLNMENIRQLQSLGYQNIHLASAEDFDLNLKFDTIVAGELIEHLSNPGMFFSRCRAHLKPNGRIIITTPYAFALLYILYAFIKFPKTCQNEEHSVWFCPETLIELAFRSGFHVDQWDLIEDYEFDNPSWSYRLFARLITTIGRVIIPARLRKNNMIFVFSTK